MRDALVQMKATTFFTRNSPTTGAILHGDARDNADVIARFPRVSEPDASYLETEKLAERYDGSVPKAGNDGRAMDVHERAAANVEEHTEADQSIDAPTGIDTRSTTHFERPVSELAGSQGSGQPRLTASNSREAPRSESEAPAGGGGPGNGAKTYATMTKGELETEADKDPKVDLSDAKNNDERAKLLETARGGKAPAGNQ